MAVHQFRQRAAGGQGGFTLAELMMALVILLTATWGAAQGLKASLSATRKAMDRLYAVHYAQHWLDYYRNKDLPTEPKGDDVTNPPSGRFDSYRGLYYLIEWEPVEQSGITPPKLTKLTFKVTPYRPQTNQSGTTTYVASGPPVTVWSYYYIPPTGTPRP